jgi:hypothetical protein
MHGQDAIFSDFGCGVLRRSKSPVVAIDIGARWICAAESPDVFNYDELGSSGRPCRTALLTVGPFDRVSTRVGKHCMKAYARRVIIKPVETDITIPTAGNRYPTLHICWDQEKGGIGVTVKQSWNLSPSTIQPSEVLIVGQRLRELLRTAQKAAPAAQRFGLRQHSRAKEDALHASTVLRNCFAGCEHRLCSTEPGCDQVLVGGGCGWLCLSGGTKWQSPRWRRCRQVLRTGGPGF